MDTDGLSTHPFSLFICNGCGLTTCFPRLLDDDLKPWYRGTYHGWWHHRASHPFHPIINFFQRLRSNSVHSHKLSGRLLDVGFGDGTFLKYMSERGWATFGLERSELYLHLGRRISGGSRLRRVSSKAHEGPAAYFDVITLWQVLEHVEDPLLLMKRLRRMLKPDGVLIISVPNFESMQSQLGGDRWFHLDIPRHRTHFTPRTLSKLLARAGLRSIEVTHFSFEYNVFGWWQTIMNRMGGSHNFAYNLLKRRELPVVGSIPERLLDFVRFSVFGGAVLFIALLLSCFEAIDHRGGTLTVWAAKEKGEPC